MLMLTIAFIINLIIIVCEGITLSHIRGKRNILKYYTYLQNFLSLIASLVFSVCLLACTVSGKAIPEFAKGLRYVATCGLMATMFVFIVFLGAGKKIAITEDDFLRHFSPRAANIILHYVCPMLSLISFVFFERSVNLSNGIWTGIAAIPSCVYWIVYFILSAAKVWEEPYDFASGGSKNNLGEMLPAFLIPVSFIAFSFILWNVQ